MKTVADICKLEKEAMLKNDNLECHHIMTPWGPKKLDKPVMSRDYKCEYCQGERHFTPYLDPSDKNTQRMLLCENSVCSVYNNVKLSKATTTQPKFKRCVEWPLFCEMNGIGDVHHAVKFEQIKQSKGKIDYLEKFVKEPSGIILMQGPPGAGKTYSALATCEAFTRFNQSCIFCTQENMLKYWLDKQSNFSDRARISNLLVIDEFGIAEFAPAFMNFFLSLINSRLQWTDRGTIITTNLNDQKMIGYCGEALNSRLSTAQKMIFNNEDRRTKKIL